MLQPGVYWPRVWDPTTAALRDLSSPFLEPLHCNLSCPVAGVGVDLTLQQVSDSQCGLTLALWYPQILVGQKLLRPTDLAIGSSWRGQRLGRATVVSREN